MFTVSCKYHLPPNVCTCNLCLRASVRAWLVDVKVYAVVCIHSIGSHRFLLECELFGRFKRIEGGVGEGDDGTRLH